MVSHRCKLSVKDSLDRLGILYGSIELGEVEILSRISADQMEQLEKSLQASGFELLVDKKRDIVEKIKTAIIEMIHEDDNFPETNISHYIANKLHFDYTYLANCFSELEGTTIERFTITHKIERVKEFLIYDELSITEIAMKMNYSSVAHLSNQFKKMTGLTPTDFKKQDDQFRKTLGDL